VDVSHAEFSAAEDLAKHNTMRLKIYSAL